MPPSNFPVALTTQHSKPFPSAGPVPDLIRHSPGPQGSPGLLCPRLPSRAPASARTRAPRPGRAPALARAPRSLRAAALIRSRGPARRAAGFVLRPACAATPHSPAGGAAAAPATVGGAKGAGGRGAGGPGKPRLRTSPRPALTASVSWLRCRRSRLCARSSSRWRSVTSLSCRSRARSSEEGAFSAAARGERP